MAYSFKGGQNSQSQPPPGMAGTHACALVLYLVGHLCSKHCFHTSTTTHHAVVRSYSALRPPSTACKLAYTQHTLNAHTVLSVLSCGTLHLIQLPPLASPCNMHQTHLQPTKPYCLSYCRFCQQCSCTSCGTPTHLPAVLPHAACIEHASEPTQPPTHTLCCPVSSTAGSASNAPACNPSPTSSQSAKAARSA